MSEASAFEPPLIVALVNNMPDAALKATERQFRAIFNDAAGNVDVCFKYFFLPGIPRGDAGLLHLSKSYDSVESLWTSQVDGLIVTGAAPCAPVFEDEPYWGSFGQLVDWAEDHAIPSYWSCLAAHAAVKHLDGIERRRFDCKKSGIFECEKMADHLLLHGAPDRWRVPHSRYNDLSEEDLTAAGYRVISRMADGSPDLFIKHRNSLAVFAQGHLEYDRESLLYEFQRDVGRFLRGEVLERPKMPEGYFDGETVLALHEWNRTALVEPGDVRQKTINALLKNATLAEGWRTMAARLFSNWVCFLLEERSRRRASRNFRAARSTQHPSSDMERRVEWAE